MVRFSAIRLLPLSIGALALGACGGGMSTETASGATVGPAPASAPAPASRAEAPATVTAAPSPSVAEAVDVDGDWTLTVQLGTGPGTRQLMLIQDGTDLTGTISSSRATGEVTGSVEGDQVRFVAVLSMNTSDFEVVYEARVVGDRMVDGTVEIPGYSSGTFTGVRKGML